MRYELPDSLLPVLRFSQPPDRFRRQPSCVGLFHPTSTPRVFPSEFYIKTIHNRFRLVASSSLPTFYGILPYLGRYSRLSSPQRITRTCDSMNMAPRSLARTGFHFRFQPTMKLFSRFDAPHFVSWFHPKNGAETLLDFSPSGSFWLLRSPIPF